MISVVKCSFLITNCMTSGKVAYFVRSVQHLRWKICTKWRLSSIRSKIHLYNKRPQRGRTSKKRAPARIESESVLEVTTRGTRDDSDCDIPTLRSSWWAELETTIHEKKKKLNKYGGWRVSPDPGHPVSLSISCDTRVGLMFFSRNSRWYHPEAGERWRDVYLRVSSSDAAVELEFAGLAMLWPNGKLETEHDGEQLCRVVCCLEELVV